MPKLPWMPWPAGNSKRRSNRKAPLPTGASGPRLPLLALLLALMISLTPLPSSAAPADPESAQPEANFRQLLKTGLGGGEERERLANLEISRAALTTKDGGVELSFTLKQLQAEPRPLELQLLIVTPGQSFTTTLTSRQAEERFNLQLPQPPTEIRLDPYLEAPRRLTAAETPATWAGFRNAPHRLAVIPALPTPDHWEPLLAYLGQQQIEVLPLAEVSDRQLGDAALLFISDGVNNPGRGFLAQNALPADAVSLEARANPLNPEYPAILLNLPPTAAENLVLLLDHLEGEGLFSSLQLQAGATTRHRLDSAARGILLELDRTPTGIAAADLRDLHSIMAELAATRVIHVGEVHSRYEDHLLQLRVLRAMHRQNPKLAIGMEMFPRSVQPVLDAYLAGELDEPAFLKESNWFDNWSFDYRLYREIIDFARHHRLPIVALNLEKGISGQVFREGVSGLTPEQQATLPPERDLGLPGYRERIGAAFRMHDKHDDPEEQRHRFGGFLQAQSLWDEQMAATMAHFLTENPDYRMLTVVGQGHTDKLNAIPPRLARRLPVSQAVVVPARENGVTATAATAADYFIFIEPQSLPEPALLGVRIRDGETGAPGALVVALSPHGSAKEAGIKENDLIIALDDRVIADAAALRIALLYKKRGEEITVKIKRKPEKAAPAEEIALPDQPLPQESPGDPTDELLDITVKL